LHIKDLEVPRVQQFSETSKIKNNSLELSIEWSLFDVNFLFEQLWNEDLNSALTISQICGFPNINITDKCPADIEKEFNDYLQKAYPLSSNLLHSVIDDKIKHSHQHAIDEVSRDLVKCSQSFISKRQSCSKFSLSSDFLSERNLINSSTNSSFAIKCKKLIDNIGTLEKGNDGYIMLTATQELFNDWIIGQNLKEYDYRFLDNFENITEITEIINISEKNQREALFNDILETKNSALESTTEYEDTYQNTSNILEKPKKKSRKSGFR
jgi:hypothetical protein